MSALNNRRILQRTKTAAACIVIIAALISFLLPGCGEVPSAPLTKLPPRAELTTGSPTSGGAYYGMMHPAWPCQKSLAIMKNQAHPSVAVLWNVFGRRLGCLKQFIADPRPKTVELILYNAACQRNHNCLSYDLLYGISVDKERALLNAYDHSFRDKIIAHVKPMIDLVATSKGTHTKFIISPELESNQYPSEGAILISWLKPHFPNATFAWSSIRGGRPAGSDYAEYHGNPRGPDAPCIADNDGLDIDLPIPGRATYTSNGPAISYVGVSDYLYNTRRCEVSFLWTRESNGLLSSGPRIDPRKRKAWPTTAVLNALKPFYK